MGGSAAAASAAPFDDWNAVLAQARGQTVYFNAWAGSERINDYIAWVGKRVAAEYGITLRHVKLADTADAVAQTRPRFSPGGRRTGRPRSFSHCWAVRTETPR